MQVATQTQSSIVVPDVSGLQVQTSHAGNAVNQFCPTLSTMPSASDMGLGTVSALTPQQQQQQQQIDKSDLELSYLTGYYLGRCRSQQAQIPVPALLRTQAAPPNTSVPPPQQASTSAGTGVVATGPGAAIPGTTTKMPGGIAKKVIDKQSRKERNRYSLLRSAANNQGKCVLQQLCMLY